ncbi:hypothetical protein V8C35DRAFT_55190 [Trichoderma chlorosporum]
MHWTRSIWYFGREMSIAQSKHVVPASGQCTHALDSPFTHRSFGASCICYNAKDPSMLANRRRQPAIGCCGGALSRHPGAASTLQPPWCCANGLEASPPAALGRCSLPPASCVAGKKRIEPKTVTHQDFAVVWMMERGGGWENEVSYACVCTEYAMRNHEGGKRRKQKELAG